jgi:ribosomal protein S6
MLDEKDLQQVKAIADEARRGAVHDMQVIIENTIMPSLKLLAEGQRTLLETMAPKTRVEELEDDMQLLKAVVRSQSERIDALEKRLA